jgi:hypothetical protein
MLGRKQVGVLTFHRCINLRCLLAGPVPGEGVRALGHEAVVLAPRSSIIDHRSWRVAVYGYRFSEPGASAAW